MFNIFKKKNKTTRVMRVNKAKALDDFSGVLYALTILRVANREEYLLILQKDLKEYIIKYKNSKHSYIKALIRRLEVVVADLDYYTIIK